MGSFICNLLPWKIILYTFRQLNSSKCEPYRCHSSQSDCCYWPLERVRKLLWGWQESSISFREQVLHCYHFTHVSDKQQLLSFQTSRGRKSACRRSWELARAYELYMFIERTSKSGAFWCHANIYFSHFTTKTTTYDSAIYVQNDPMRRGSKTFPTLSISRLFVIIIFTNLPRNF